MQIRHIGSVVLLSDEFALWHSICHQCNMMSERKFSGSKRNRATSGRMVVSASKLSNYWSSLLLGLLKIKGLRNGVEILIFQCGCWWQLDQRAQDHCKCFLGKLPEGARTRTQVAISKITFREYRLSSANLAKCSELSMLTTSQPSILIEMSHSKKENNFIKFRISSDWKHD